MGEEGLWRCSQYREFAVSRLECTLFRGGFGVSGFYGVSKVSKGKWEDKVKIKEMGKDLDMCMYKKYSKYSNN